MFNWGSAILTQAADLVTGHELGHNFGSNHDPPECIPSYNRGGAYLMNARAVSGLQRNNRLFSPCSRASIGRILGQLNTSRLSAVRYDEYRFGLGSIIIDTIGAFKPINFYKLPLLNFEFYVALK